MNQHDDWLWDGRGKPDADTAQLRATLAPLAWQPRAHARPRRRWAAPARLALAACIAGAVAIGGWWHHRLQWPAGDAWTVVSAEGAVTGITRGEAHAAWPVGRDITTGADGRVRIRVARIGDLEVAPGSRLRLDETRSGRHRIALRQGEVRARVWAPPHHFGMSLARSELWDLGCEFTVRVDARGDGDVVVHSGWVQFDDGTAETLVPQGTRVRLSNGAPTGVARDLGATPEFLSALLEVEAHAAAMRADDPRLARVVAAARPQDAITLVSLAQRHPRLIAGPLRDGIRRLLPHAGEVIPSAAARGTPGALDPWWDALPYPRAKQWWWHWRDGMPAGSDTSAG